MNSPTLHLPMENPILALFSVLPQLHHWKSSLKGWFCYRGDEVRRQLRKGLQEEGSALTKQGEGRNKHRNLVDHKDAQPQPPFDLYFTSQAGPHLRQLPI